MPSTSSLALGLGLGLGLGIGLLLLVVVVYFCTRRRGYAARRSALYEDKAEESQICYASADRAHMTIDDGLAGVNTYTVSRPAGSVRDVSYHKDSTSIRI